MKRRRVVWLATDNAGTPPPAIKASFPDLVPEVPRAFERPVQGCAAAVSHRLGHDPRQGAARAGHGRAITRSVVALAFAHFAAEQPIDEHRRSRG